ncbi:FitA-like ribbon-helix-helix domain-containing protein [Iningainema tapete]|uniref:Antitoxin FitA-like ribbon-helix-helix domain-containing protein n=1 Tax=Iningainema tapete BLCC-T55 TaxID=2748662 RepID=A0A8J6XNP1_9CYAN|nr:hypothetical protein [Iningainema tapete]MBD2775285.1 hypothetical protein [Iningainema tapete BLCC-T55]
MTHIILEDLDPVMIERLKARAQKHGRSLPAEVKAILQQVTQAQAKPNSSEDEIIQRKSASILQPTFRTLTVTKGFLLKIFSTMRVKKHFTCSYSHIIYLP